MDFHRTPVAHDFLQRNCLRRSRSQRQPSCRRAGSPQARTGPPGSLRVCGLSRRFAPFVDETHLDRDARLAYVIPPMAIEVKIPSVGESITSGVVSAWHKKSGELVSEGEALFTLETDKVSTEIVAEKTGILETKVPEGQEVKIGEIVAIIDDSKRPSEKQKVPEAKKAEKSAEKKKEPEEKKEDKTEKKSVKEKQ